MANPHTTFHRKKPRYLQIFFAFFLFFIFFFFFSHWFKSLIDWSVLLVKPHPDIQHQITEIICENAVSWWFEVGWVCGSGNGGRVRSPGLLPPSLWAERGWLPWRRPSKHRDSSGGDQLLRWALLYIWTWKLYFPLTHNKRDTQFVCLWLWKNIFPQRKSREIEMLSFETKLPLPQWYEKKFNFTRVGSVQWKSSNCAHDYLNQSLFCIFH